MIQTASQSKADLHVHSKYSDRPSEWFLRRIGAPECFVEPMFIYETAKARGMDFVTISDHNCINGALEIAHLPNTFISCEVTTYFPEDGCKIHCLVTGINQEQFKMIQELRPNIYEFQKYVVQQDIVYSCAHPLYSVNDRLTIDHVEKLLLLFNRFEGINGARHPRAAELVNAIFRNVSKEMIDEMANRQNLAPLGSTPWVKTFTGGSDDHSGVFIAHAYTVTDKANDVAGFLQNLRQGDHEMAGRSGTSLRLAHTFYQIGYSYYKAHFLGLTKKNPSDRHTLVGELLKMFAHEQAEAKPAPKKKGGIGSGVRSLTEMFIRPIRKRRLSEMDRMLVDEFTKLFGSDGQKLPSTVGLTGEQQNFETACRICHQLGYRFLVRFTQEMGKGHFFESLQAIAALGPVALSIAPYIAAFKTQHKDEWMLQTMSRHFAAGRTLLTRSQKKAWIGHVHSDTSAVAQLLQGLSVCGKQMAKPMTLVTCQEHTPQIDIDSRHFVPVGQFTIPEIKGSKLVFPPFLEMIAYLEDQKFSEVVIATPDTLGLNALAAGRLLGMRMTGVFLNDIADMLGRATEDDNIEELSWRYLLWFYDQMHQVLVPSAEIRKNLVDRGFSADKVMIAPALACVQAGRSPRPGDSEMTELVSQLWPTGEAPTAAEVTLMAPYQKLVPRKAASLQSMQYA